MYSLNPSKNKFAHVQVEHNDKLLNFENYIVTFLSTEAAIFFIIAEEKLQGLWD